MIKLIISDDHGDLEPTVLAVMKIERVVDLGRVTTGRKAWDSEPTGDYTVQLAVTHPNGDIGLHQTRIEDFPRMGANVLRLVEVALRNLDPEAKEVSAWSIPGAVKHGGAEYGTRLVQMIENKMMGESTWLG
jgi:hypothetical protein